MSVLAAPFVGQEKKNGKCTNMRSTKGPQTQPQVLKYIELK